MAERLDSLTGAAAEADCNRSSSASISSTENAFERPSIFSFFLFYYTATQDEFETCLASLQDQCLFIDLLKRKALLYPWIKKLSNATFMIKI